MNLREKDNLRRKDKSAVPKVSFLRRFHCISLTFLPVCHGVMNALISARWSDFSDCSVYCTHDPCHECKQIITKCGIRLNGDGNVTEQIEVGNLVNQELNERCVNCVNWFSSVNNDNVGMVVPKSVEASMQQNRG